MDAPQPSQFLAAAGAARAAVDHLGHARAVRVDSFDAASFMTSSRP